MNLAWTKHISNPEEKQRFEESIKNGKTALERLDQLIQEQLDSMERLETKPDYYDNPSWAAKQAHQNGARTALLGIKKLLTLDQEGSK